jgi:nucleoside-diphosphate-sugar epimerase
MTRRILVTGANGFIGSALCKRLHSDGFKVVAAVRHSDTLFPLQGVQTAVVGNIDDRTDWSAAVAGSKIVVHLAARAHVMKDSSREPLTRYRRVNVEGTGRLADQAKRAGVERFLYLSSVKVNGEENEHAYSEVDDVCPQDDYAISKMEAEKRLKAITDQSDMDHVILRPPLVYGPEVKANFLALIKLVSRKVPLPLGRVTNRRSFVYVGNLVDAVCRCLTHPMAAGQTYLVSDGRDLTTAELIRWIAAALEVPCFLPPCPPTFLRALGRFSGRADAVRRLLGSLTVDTSKITGSLDWTPPFSVETGLRDTAKWFKKDGSQ